VAKQASTSSASTSSATHRRRDSTGSELRRVRRHHHSGSARPHKNRPSTHPRGDHGRVGAALRATDGWWARQSPLPPPRTSNSSYCGTRSPCSAAPTRDHAWTGRTGPSSPPLVRRLPRALHRHRLVKFTAAFDAVLAGADIRIIRTPVRAPRANAIVERWIGTLRRECLDPPSHLGLPRPRSCGGIAGW
jgi:hypothetical protein